MTQSGTVEFRTGRTQSGDTVAALARILSVLLPRDRPTKLRLLVTTAGPDSGAYKSVNDFKDALKYFECPGRRNILSEVYQRALDTPVERLDDEVVSPRRKPKADRRHRRGLVPIAAMVVLVAVVAGAVVLSGGYVAYCVQKLLSRKSGHGTRLLVEVDLLTKE